MADLRAPGLGSVTLGVARWVKWLRILVMPPFEILALPWLACCWLIKRHGLTVQK